MKVYSFTIDGTLPGLNEYIAAERTNKYKAASLKRQCEMIIRCAIRKKLRGVHIKAPVCIDYIFYEKNKRRDHDNVFSIAAKFTQDSLVKEGVIQNDGWKGVDGFTADFQVDNKNPRIEVMLREVTGK